MMTTANAIYRDEEVVQEITPESATPASTPTAAAATPESDTKAITITLDTTTFAYFRQKAKEDERTISAFIARTLRGHVAEKTAQK